MASLHTTELTVMSKARDLLLDQVPMILCDWIADSQTMAARTGNSKETQGKRLSPLVFHGRFMMVRVKEGPEKEMGWKKGNKEERKEGIKKRRKKGRWEERQEKRKQTKAAVEIVT